MSEIIAYAGMAEKLCGYTVVETIVDVENNRWGLKLVKADGLELDVWVDADPEGNGPGFLDVRTLEGERFV